MLHDVCFSSAPWAASIEHGDAHEVPLSWQQLSSYSSSHFHFLLPVSCPSKEQGELKKKITAMFKSSFQSYKL